MSPVDWIMAASAVGGAIGATIGWLVDRHVKKRSATIRIVADSTELQRAFQKVAEDFRKMHEQVGTALLPSIRGMSRALASMSLLFTPGAKSEVIIRMRQNQLGSRNRAADGAWQSDLCAAWVHGACPLPANCDCRCHR